LTNFSPQLGFSQMLAFVCINNLLLHVLYLSIDLEHRGRENLGETWQNEHGFRVPVDKLKFVVVVRGAVVCCVQELGFTARLRVFSCLQPWRFSLRA